MKLVNYNHGGSGVVIDDNIVALADLDGVPTDIAALLAAGPDVAEVGNDVSVRAASSAQPCSRSQHAHLVRAVRADSGGEKLPALRRGGAPWEVLGEERRRLDRIGVDAVAVADAVAQPITGDLAQPRATVLY